MDRINDLELPAEFIRFLKWVAEGRNFDPGIEARTGIAPVWKEEFRGSVPANQIIDYVENPHHYKKDFERFQKWEKKQDG